MQMGFYFNQELCTHCCACVVACKDWHDVPPGPASYIRITVIEKGKFPEVSMCAMFETCYHCTDPICASVCPSDAIIKRGDNGIVLVNREACLGNDACGQCREACPYNAPQFAAEEDAKMQKCDFCSERLGQNKNPICVDACNFNALDFGPMEILKAKYGKAKQQAEGFLYVGEISPSILFKPMKIKERPVQKKMMLPPVSKPKTS